MPLKLMAPIVKEFSLDEIDEDYDVEGDPTIIMIRQATQREAELRAAVFNRITSQYSQAGDGVVREVREIPWTELTRKEVYLTLAGSNIEEENGKQLFKFKGERLDMSQSQFEKAWGKLPPVICRKIHECVIDVNMTWSGKAEDMEEAADEGAGSKTEVPLVETENEFPPEVG